jgi:hypothetical protein
MASLIAARRNTQEQGLNTLREHRGGRRKTQPAQ